MKKMDLNKEDLRRDESFEGEQLVKGSFLF